ncbi:uncharacterized protein LOC124145469 [Haliotis rufescens]|uniref:uncharacterized protein LOC124145469 n=1 Tax=Haliotis rufescens TaxID=6454 RepID=UPI00201F4B1D|nr:uncharacterized protein LOC124145469 [Haliotis rufescens]
MLPPISSMDLVSPRSNHSMRSSDSSMSSRYSSSSFNSDLTSTYKIVSTSLCQASTRQPHPPPQQLRHTMQEAPCIQAFMSQARPGSARLAEHRYVPLVRNAFLVDADDKEMYSPRSLKLDRASSTTDLLPRFDNYTQTPRDSATQTPRRHREQMTTDATTTSTSDAFVDQETQTPRSSRHGIKKKRRKKYEDLELSLHGSDTTVSVDSEMNYEDKNTRNRNRNMGVSSTSESYRSTSIQDLKTKICQTSFSIESEESFPSLRRRHRNRSETVTLKSVDEDNAASSLPNSTVHLFKDDNMSDSVFDSEEQNGRYVGSAIDSENRADVLSSEEYVAYDRAGEAEKTQDTNDTELHGAPGTEKQLDDSPKTLGNESNEDSFWETRGDKDSPLAAGSDEIVDENACSDGHKDQTTTEDTSQLESAQTKDQKETESSYTNDQQPTESLHTDNQQETESLHTNNQQQTESPDTNDQPSVVSSEVWTVSPENVTVEEPASADTAIEVVKSNPEVDGEDAKNSNLSQSFDDVCRGAVELTCFEEDPRGDRIFSDMDGTTEEYRGNFLNNLSETNKSDPSSRYKKFTNEYMHVPEERGSDGETLVDSDTDPEVYTKPEQIFTREETDEQHEVDEELCRGAAPAKRKNSDASSYCSATRALGETNTTYQETITSRANSVTSQATLSSVRGSRITAWKTNPSGGPASAQSDKSEQTAVLDLTQDLLDDEDFFEVTEVYEADMMNRPTAVTTDVNPITDDRTSSCSRGSGDKVPSPSAEMPSRGEEEFLNLETLEVEMKCEVLDRPVDTEDRQSSCSLSTGTGDGKRIVSDVDAPVEAEIHLENDGNKIGEDRLETSHSGSRGNVDKNQHDLTISSRGGDEASIEPLNTTKDDNDQIQETHHNSEVDVKYEPNEDREEFDTAVSEGAESDRNHEITAEAGIPRPNSSCSTSRGFVMNDSSLQGSSQAVSSRGHHNDETVASIEESTDEGNAEDVVEVNKNATDYVTNDNFNNGKNQLQESTVPTVDSVEERGDTEHYLNDKKELGVLKTDEICEKDNDSQRNMKSEMSHEKTSLNLPSDDEVFDSDPTVSMGPVSAHCVRRPSVSPPRPISACRVKVPPLLMGDPNMKQTTAVADELHIEAGSSDDEVFQMQTSDCKDIISHDESRGQIDTTLGTDAILCEEQGVNQDDQISQNNTVSPSPTKDENVKNNINIVLDLGAPVKPTAGENNPRRPVSAHCVRNNPVPNLIQRPVSAHHRQMPDMTVEEAFEEQCATVAGPVTMGDDDSSKGNGCVNEAGTVLLDESRGQMDVTMEAQCQGDLTDKVTTFMENEPRESGVDLQEEMKPVVPEMFEQSEHQDITSQVLTTVNRCDDGTETSQSTEPKTDSEVTKSPLSQEATDLDLLTEYPVHAGSSLSMERGETTNSPRPVQSPPWKKLERSASVCSRGSASDDNDKICSQEIGEQIVQLCEKESDVVPGSVCLEPNAEIVPKESKPGKKSQPEGESSDIYTPVVDAKYDVKEMIQAQASHISEGQDMEEEKQPYGRDVAARRGSIIRRDAALTGDVVTGVLSPTPSVDSEVSHVPPVLGNSHTDDINCDSSRQRKILSFQDHDVMTNSKTNDLCLPDDKLEEKPKPNILISKESLNFFSFDDPDESKVGHSFISSEESVTLQTSNDTLMNDSTESSTTGMSTTNTTDTLEEHYSRTDQLIPANILADISRLSYKMFDSNIQNQTVKDTFDEKLDPKFSDEIDDEVPATGTKTNVPVHHEESPVCEVDAAAAAADGEEASREDGASPAGIFRPLSVLGLPQKDLSNRRLSLESRGSSDFIIETEEVLIASSRGDEVMPENIVGELPTNNNIPESETFTTETGYHQTESIVVEPRGDVEEETYCSLAHPSGPSEEPPNANNTHKGQGDMKVINSLSCTNPSLENPELSAYLGNVKMNALIAVVDDSPVDVDYTKSGKSKQTSYQLVLNEEHDEPKSRNAENGNDADRVTKVSDDKKDRTKRGVTGLEDKCELNIPACSIVPELQNLNMSADGMTCLNEGYPLSEQTGNTKTVTFVDGDLPEEDILTSDSAPKEAGNVVEPQGSHGENLTRKAVLKSEVIMPELSNHQNSDKQEDLNPQKSEHKETSVNSLPLQANINRVTETEAQRGVSEKVDEPEVTRAANPNHGHRRQSTSLHGPTVITVAEAQRGVSEKVDESEDARAANPNHGHRRQSTDLHLPTVITVAEAKRGVSEKVDESEVTRAANPNHGHRRESTSLHGPTVITVAEAQRGVSEQVDEPEVTKAANPNNGHRRMSTSLHGPTVITVAEAQRGVSEKVDESEVTRAANPNHGHRRQSTGLHGPTVITVAEAQRGVSEQVDESEVTRAANPNHGHRRESTSLHGPTVITVAETGQDSGAVAIFQRSNEAVDGQVEFTSQHQVIVVSEREGLPDEATDEDVMQGEQQNRRSPPRNEEKEEKKEVESEQHSMDTVNAHAKESNDQLSDEAFVLKPMAMSETDGVSSVQETVSSCLNGDLTGGRPQTSTTKHGGMSVSGNMAESDAQSLSDSERGLHSDQMSGHRIILVSENIPTPVAKAKVIERHPGGPRVILVSEKSQV